MIQIGVAVAEQIGVMDMHDLSVVRFGIGDYAQKSVKVRGNRSGILRNMGGAPQHARAACAPVQYDGGAYNYRVVGLSCHVRKFSADVWGDSRTKKVASTLTSDARDKELLISAAGAAPVRKLLQPWTR
jgi:hypothetical protein